MGTTTQPRPPRKEPRDLMRNRMDKVENAIKDIKKDLEECKDMKCIAESAESNAKYAGHLVRVYNYKAWGALGAASVFGLFTVANTIAIVSLFKRRK